MDQNTQPNTLPFGILSLALCGFFGIFGIIFGAIGRKKGKAFVAEGGQLVGASKVGFILSKIGFIFGIIGAVFGVIYIIMAIVAAKNGVNITSY